MEEEDPYEAGSLYVVTIEPYLTSQKPPITQTQFDQSHTVDFFKLKLESLIKADLRMQKKLKKLHRLQYQLSLLLNKNIDGKYGILPDNSNTPKSIITPLPPIEKGVLSDLLRILHSISPIELRKYISQSGIVEQLIFGDSSIFNSRLLESLVRTPPDIQVSFIVSILEQIRSCSDFYNKLISTISQFSLEGSLKNQLVSPNSNLSLFLKFYSKSLNHIANICKADECKIIFYSNTNDILLFPTQELTYIISSNDSLSGILIKQSSPSRIEYPRQEKSFEATTEGQLFNSDDPILSVPIKVDKDSTIGLIILIRHSTKFSITDELISTKVSKYLSPILQHFRSVFVQINPSQYSQLFQCIASLRSNEQSLFKLLKEQFCTLTSATFCKLYINGYEITDPELKQLPQEPSLVRKSYETETVMSHKNPRNNPEFNKKVDDESSLSKIQSILIVPVKNSPIMIVLYNPQTSSELTDLQKSLASLLSISLQPLFSSQIEEERKQRGEKQQEKTASIVSISESLSLVGRDEFVESMKQFLPPGVEVCLYFFIDEKSALKLPSNEVIQTPKFLIEIEEEVHFKADSDGFAAKLKELDIQNEVKCLLAIPAVFSDHKTVCTFASKKVNTFVENVTFYQKMGRLLLNLLLPHVCRLQLDSIRERSSLVDGATRLQTESISPFVGAGVGCHFFDKPAKEVPRPNKPLSIMVETPRGIEATLTADGPVRSETARSAFVSFAELMSAVLTSKKGQIKEPPAVFLSFLVDLGVLDIFGCTILKFSEWVSKVCSIYEDGGVDYQKRIDKACFVSKMIVAKKWEGWFSKEEKIVIVLIVFLNEIEKCWRCTVDDQLVEIFNELNCRPVSGLLCSILFGAGFGICVDSTSLAQKKLLIKKVDDFVIGNNARDFAEVFAHIRVLSLHSFKQSEGAKVWLGISLVLISDIQEFAELNEEMIRQLAIKMDEIERKKTIHKIDKMFVPMMSFMSKENETIDLILSNIRSSLKIINEAKV